MKRKVERLKEEVLAESIRRKQWSIGAKQLWK